MTKSPVSAFVGPIPAFRRRSTFVAGAFLQASRDGGGARGSDLDGRAAETSPQPQSRDGPLTDDQRRSIDRLVVEGKTSAANDGHPHEAMSSARSDQRHCRRRSASFPRCGIFRDSYALAKGGQNRRPIRIGRKKQVRILGRDVAGSARQPFRRSFCLAPTTGRKRSPSPPHSPRLCAALSPTRSASNGCVRRISSAKAEFLARQIRRPSPSSACAPALRVQAAQAGLFCAAPRGTRWRWASGPRRKKKVLQNGFQPLQVLPQA
jgi:hypothetical protein